MVRSGIVVVGIVMSLSGSVFAGEDVVKAGEGYEIVSGQRTVDVRKGKRRATLLTGYVFDLKATPEAKAKKVTISFNKECSADLSEVYSYDQLEARLVNTEALVLHRKKDWANAAKGFAQAVKLDPTWKLPAFNLASAHSRLGQLVEANAALAPWLKAEPLATFIQVSIDPELQPLLATKEVAAAKGATRPGTIKVSPDGAIDGTYAYSAERGWLAVPHSDAGYMDCGAPDSIRIFDVKAAKVLASIPLGSIPGTEEFCQPRASKAEVEKAKKARAEKAKIAETVLVGFGFAKVASESAGVTDKDDDSGKRVGRFDKAKIGVVENGGSVNVLRGNTSLGKGTISGGKFTGATYFPDAKAMVLVSYVPSDMCARTDEDVITINDPGPPPAKK